MADLGGTVMVVGTDGPPKPSLESLDELGKVLAEVAEAADKRVRLAVEFNWGPLVKSLRAARRAVDAANHPRVGILFDTAHYFCTTSKAEDLTPATLAKVFHVHVDDMRDKPAELSNCNNDRVLPGEGTLDLKGILGRVAAGGYKGDYAIELFTQSIWDLPVAEASRQCYRAMERLSATLAA